MVVVKRITKVDVIQTRVTRKTKKRVEALAMQRGMTVVDWVRFLIDKEIEANDKKDSQ